MICLLDTNTLVYMLRGLKIVRAANPRQLERLRVAQKILSECQARQTAGDQVGLSAITVAELEYGARHSGDYPREMVAVQKILTPFVLFDFDATACAAHYGEIRDHPERTGVPLGAMDLLIASHARALGATLVTNDSAPFSSIPNLKLENWAG
jgi:tRNA(fMet)-specific endonuclease VapC